MDIRQQQHPDNFIRNEIKNYWTPLNNQIFNDNNKAKPFLYNKTVEEHNLTRYNDDY